MDASEETPIGACVARVARRRRRASHEPRARLRAPRRPPSARDVLTAAVLCESLARGPGEADVRSVTRVRDAFPSGAVRIRGVSVARGSSARHGYLVADAPGAVFVACAGTRDARDLVTDVSVRSADLDLAAEAGTRRPGDRSRRALAAHGGTCVARARSEGARAGALQERLLRDGKRLVLCGRSLGGAVAALALLGLLLDIEDAEGRADDDADGAPSTGPSTASDENEDENEDDNVFAKPRKRKSLARLLVADGVLACVGFAAPPWTRRRARVRGDQGLDARVRERLLAGGFRAEADARPARRAKAPFQKKRFFSLKKAPRRRSARRPPTGRSVEQSRETARSITLRGAPRTRASRLCTWWLATARSPSWTRETRGRRRIRQTRAAGRERPGGVFPPSARFPSPRARRGKRSRSTPCARTERVCW